ncbi:MAG: NAD(P)/FAD-dependent oxidoreductase [Thermodesulfobacteriota bacterium]|nr:NAD(P)/FAD-dependent oxidoreductase [Thermodesulfobacteriota bacterium]
MTSDSTYDLAVVGAGPGGFEAALAGASLGLSTVLVEKGHFGGTCLNTGCIPTKLFLGASASVHELHAQARLKIAQGRIDIDLPSLQNRKQKILAGHRKAMQSRLVGAGVTIVNGAARLESRTKLVAESETSASEISFKSLVLATGSRPAVIPGMVPDQKIVLDSDGLLDLEQAPESLAVLGAGAVGLEMARFFSALRTKIILVEALERIAPFEDPEVSEALLKIFKREGWTVHVGKKAASLKVQDGQARLLLETGEEILAQKALTAFGRSPNTENLGLENAGLELDPRGFVLVDENLRAAGQIFAIGDVNGKAMLAHAASDQARFAVRFIAAKEKGPYTPAPIPWCVYGAPESLRVGEMAHDLKARGLPIQVSKSPLAANPIAQAHAAPHGFVKAVWSEGKLMGVTAVGFNVTHLATQAAIMVKQSWTRDNVKQLIFAHPTLDEALRDALLAEPVEV